MTKTKTVSRSKFLKWVSYQPFDICESGFLTTDSNTASFSFYKFCETFVVRRKVRRVGSMNALEILLTPCKRRHLLEGGPEASRL